MKFFLGNSVNIRLNDSAVLNIQKYKNGMGDSIHNLTLYYEGDNPHSVGIGTFYCKLKNNYNRLIAGYDFNNHRIACWEENEQAKEFTVTRIFDVESEEDLLTGDSIKDYFIYSDTIDDIEKNKLKKLKLNNKSRKRS